MKSIKQGIIVLIVVLGFTGCRPSPVIEQVIYTKNATVIDKEQQQLEPETKAKESEQLKPETKEDAKNKKDTKKEAGKVDTNSKETNAPSGETKSEAKETKAKPKETKKQETKKQETKKQETTAEETSLEEESTIEETSDQDVDETIIDDTGDDEEVSEEETTEAPKKIVSDGKGEEQEIPEDVHQVTAVGSVASIVEMLGGSERLAGSSSDFTSSSLIKSLCSDVSEGKVETWWSDDGSEAISSSNFKKLLKAKPDVCFEISGQNTFSSSQIKQLESEGISYMVLPELNSVQNLKDTVTIVASVLDENYSSGKSATKIAKSYCDWVDDTISTVESKTSKVALASLYITQWRDDISYQFTKKYESLPKEAARNGKGSGVAIAWSPKKDEMMTTFMNAAGVTNTSTANGNLDDTELSYVTPMFHQFFPEFSSNEYSYYDKNIAAGADWFVVNKLSDSTFDLLGTKEFPAIIVANKEIKSSIENNWYWKYWGEITGSDWGFGYVAEDGTSYYSSIGGDYDIYVNPTGIGSWADGSIDSPLEVYWIANKISGKVSDSTLKSEVKGFYKEFFDVSLSDGQVNKIIGE